jgi:hypothetical protein
MKSMAAAGCVTIGIAVWLGAQAAMAPQAPPSDLPPVDYSLGRDSQPHPDVPRGTLTRHTLAPGKFFPGTPHKPEFNATPVTSIAFGGPGRTWLYVTQGGRLFRRETKRTGVVAWEPVKPPQPGL